jgi:hypothetical protein
MYSKEQILENIKRHGVQPDKTKEKYIYNGVMVKRDCNKITFHHAGGSCNYYDYKNYSEEKQCINNYYPIFEPIETDYILKNGLIEGCQKIKDIRDVVKKKVVNKQIDLLDLITLQEFYNN